MVTTAMVGFMAMLAFPEPITKVILAVLTLVAITHGVLFRGERILFVPMPHALIDALDLVRASGRLFWPVAYTIVYAAIIVIGICGLALDQALLLLRHSAIYWQREEA